MKNDYQHRKTEKVEELNRLDEKSANSSPTVKSQTIQKDRVTQDKTSQMQKSGKVDLSDKVISTKSAQKNLAIKDGIEKEESGAYSGEDIHSGGGEDLFADSTYTYSTSTPYEILQLAQVEAGAAGAAGATAGAAATAAGIGTGTALAIGAAVLAAGGIAIAVGSSGDNGGGGTTEQKDTTPPTPGTLSLENFTDTGVSSNDFISSDNTFNLKVTGNEAGSTVKYMVSKDGGTTWAETDAELKNLSDGTYQFKAVVEDKAGNKSETNIVEVTIDTTPPTINISDDESGDLVVKVNGINEDRDITYTISFDEEVCVFDQADISVIGGTIKAFEEVESGKTYKVTVQADYYYDGKLAITINKNGFTDIAGNNIANNFTDDSQIVKTDNFHIDFNNQVYTLPQPTEDNQVIHLYLKGEGYLDLQNLEGNIPNILIESMASGTFVSINNIKGIDGGGTIDNYSDEGRIDINIDSDLNDANIINDGSAEVNVFLDSEVNVDNLFLQGKLTVYFNESPTAKITLDSGEQILSYIGSGTANSDLTVESFNADGEDKIDLTALGDLTFVSYDELDDADEFAFNSTDGGVYFHNGTEQILLLTLQNINGTIDLQDFIIS